MISGILLAAGESSRMQGAFKPLLKWGKRTVIGECVHQMRNSQLAEIFVVLGHREMEIRQTLAGSGVQYAINEDYRRGMLSSVKAGLALLSPNEDAALIALVDQPMITKEIIDKTDEVEIFRQQLADGLYKIWPMKPIGPGEYAVVEYTEGKGNPQVWDFSVVRQ